MAAEGVHGGYEDDMIAYGVTNAHLAGELAKRVKDMKSDPKEKIADITTGYEAAKAVIALIHRHPGPK